MTATTAVSETRTQAFDLSPRSLDEAMRMADLLANSSIIPKDFIGKPGNILVAVQWGAEIGLKPMQAMQSVAVINGKPSLWGDSVLALVLSSPHCKDVLESYEGDPSKEDYAAICVAQRHGRQDVTARFSVKDAKAAGLIGKAGPWTQYRDRMLKMRARSFALRDQFPDVLKGMDITEAVMDIEPIKDITPGKTPQAIGEKARLKADEKAPGERKALIATLEGATTLADLQEMWFKLSKEDRILVGGDELGRIKDALAKAVALPTFDDLMDRLIGSTNNDEVHLVLSQCGHLPEEERVEVEAACALKLKGVA